MEEPPGKLTNDKFDALFLDCTNMIYSLGLRLFHGREDDAGDFVQDVYLRASSKKSSFRGEARFSTWLYSLAMNLGLNRIKRDKRFSFEEPPDNLVDPGGENQVLDRILEKETTELIQKEIENLPEIYRLCLVLFYYEKLTYTQIAEKLSQKEGTIKSYIHRGKKLLRQSLEGQRP